MTLRVSSRDSSRDRMDLYDVCGLRGTGTSRNAVLIGGIPRVRQVEIVLQLMVGTDEEEEAAAR